MTTATSQPVRTTVTDRLRSRIAELGAVVGLLSNEGKLTVQSAPDPLFSLFAQAAPFAAVLRDAWGALTGETVGPISVWPGVVVFRLPANRRRRFASAGRPADEMIVGLIVTTEFLDSEHFHLFCSAVARDTRDTRSQFERARLPQPVEVERISSALRWLFEDAAEIERGAGEILTMSKQLAESYEELSLLYKLSSNMTVNQPPAIFLQNALRELQEVVGLKWVALQIVSGDPRLEDLAGRVLSCGDLSCNADTLSRIGRLLLEKHAPGGKPVIIDDTNSSGVPDLAAAARHVLVIPLVKEQKPLGVLFGGDKGDGSQISSVDSKLCVSLSNSLAIFLENTMLYEDMQAMFLGTLHALTSSIDAKDSYTRGHSERVALMSRQLAIAAGFDEHLVERIYVSGLVHDVGKIGVPESVLCKPGQLNDEEFALIKLHPEIGARILRDIRQMEDLIPGVLHHHERWDGRGYPHGLAGEKIPLFGRVICLADSFDAMSSNRTYRAALKSEQVLHEIRRCAGKQFDPKLAELFVNLDFAPFYALLEKHHGAARAGGNAA